MSLTNATQLSNFASGIGTAPLQIDNLTNRVGVGTTAPLAVLDVSDNGIGTCVLIRQTGTGDALMVNDEARPDSTPFVIDSDGNVGVGTTQANENLDLYGTVQVSSTTGTQRVLIDSDGNVNLDSGGVYYDATNNRLGIGTTSPSTKLSVINTSAGSIASQLLVGNQSDTDGTGAEINFSALGSLAATGSIQNVRDGSGLYSLRFKTYQASSNAEAMRIDGSGRLLVGISTARSNFYNTTLDAGLQIENIGSTKRGLALVTNSSSNDPSTLVLAKSNANTIGSNTLVTNNQWAGNISFQGNDGTEFVALAYIDAYVDGTPGTNDMPGRLVFSTTEDGQSSPTSRHLLNNLGNTRLFCNATSDTLYPTSAAAAGTSRWLIYGLYGATSLTTGGTASFGVYTNGNVINTNNSYGTLSDIKLKENITDANSQWNDLKSIRICNFNLKEGQTHRQIGVIAQEVELVSPGLVYETPDRDEEGNETGDVTKGVNYSVLYIKAIKALQEAMERIETLEASNADLLARVSVLEQG